MKTYYTIERHDGQTYITPHRDIKDAGKLMAKINSKGGNAYVTSFLPNVINRKAKL